MESIEGWHNCWTKSLSCERTLGKDECNLQLLSSNTSGPPTPSDNTVHPYPGMSISYPLKWSLGFSYLYNKTKPTLPCPYAWLHTSQSLAGIVSISKTRKMFQFSCSHYRWLKFLWPYILEIDLPTTEVNCSLAWLAWMTRSRNFLRWRWLLLISDHV